MIVNELNRLDNDYIAEIRRLEAICQAHEGLRGNICLDKSLNFDGEMKTTFLMYDEGELISVLSMFVPTRQEAEIQAYTRPDYRQRGCFHALLDRAAAELRRGQIGEVLFVCESGAVSGRQTMVSLGAEHDFSEHLMRLCRKETVAEQGRPAMIELYRPGLDELEELIRVSRLVFFDSYEAAYDLISRTLRGETREQLAARLHGEIVGLGAVSIEGDEAAIFGFGVVPEHRGRGIGADFLRSIIADLHARGLEKITLEVDASNAAALNLYRRSGFTVTTTFDYYRKRVPA